MKKLIILTAISSLVTLGILVFRQEDGNTASTTPTTMIKTPVQHRRTPDQTFLTYPEWFLVYSPEEFAAFTAANPPHCFPFFGHLRQFWGAYGSVNHYIFKRYPFNFGYHVMVLVIGGSTTVEYVLRSCYENTIGRLSYATTGNKFTEEDTYAAAVAREYVDFINVTPWYEFDFGSKLKSLWKTTPATGKNMIRKWERRYILTSEYAVKAVYGWLIKAATKASYEAPILNTAVVSDKSDDVMFLPRYDSFKIAAMNLALQGGNFREIAGNSDVIMISCILEEGQQSALPASSKILFAQPIITRPGKTRYALIVPVADLAHQLREIHRTGIVLEHIYDY